MSDSAENLTPGVKKQTRRFAPVKRGARAGGSPSVARPAGESEPAAEGSATPKSSTIGTIRPESVSSGRLQSVNEGQQKPRGGGSVRV